MTVIRRTTVLRELLVKDAMRRQVIRLPGSASLEKAIRFLIKYKVNALLITDDDDRPAGVVSKTDLMGAYYAQLPVETPVNGIMVGPPLMCGPDDSLDSALNMMRSSGVYRLYVAGPDSGEIVGVLAYPDIVGILYQYCRNCDQSLFRRRASNQANPHGKWVTVREVMTETVTSLTTSSSLLEIMEVLSAYRFGAVLIEDENHGPRGVISKTDLILAYKHGVASESPAGSLLTSFSVVSCDESDYIEDAIRRMVVSGVQRVFVHRDEPSRIVGVFSLSDVARLRSGSCHACVSARITVE